MRRVCGNSWKVQVVGRRERASTFNRHAKYIEAPSGPNMWVDEITVDQLIHLRSKAFGDQEGSLAWDERDICITVSVLVSVDMRACNRAINCPTDPSSGIFYQGDKPSGHCSRKLVVAVDRRNTFFHERRHETTSMQRRISE